MMKRSEGTGRPLRPSEMKTTWQFLCVCDKVAFPKTAILARTVLDWQAGKIPEPQFIALLRRLIG